MSALRRIITWGSTLGLVAAIVAGVVCWRAGPRRVRPGAFRPEFVVAAYVVLAAAGIAVLAAG